MSGFTLNGKIIFIFLAWNSGILAVDGGLDFAPSAHPIATPLYVRLVYAYWLFAAMFCAEIRFLFVTIILLRLPSVL